MAGTVDVPGIKKPLPTWAVGGGVAVVGYLVYKHYKTSSAASPAAAAASTDQYPPDGTTGNPSDPYSTDPATGQTYGDEQAGSGGTFGAYPAAGSYGYDSSGIIGYDSNGNPIYAPGYGPGGSGGTGGPPFSSNAAWSAYVLAQMQATNPSADTGALTDALGAYLAGQPLDAAQKTLVQDAEAIAGPPPVAGPNGYPPKLQLDGSKGGGGSAGGSGWYWHASKAYFTFGGRYRNHPAGNVTIAGRTYYYHPAGDKASGGHPYFTVGGRAVANPPSGKAT